MNNKRTIKTRILIGLVILVIVYIVWIILTDEHGCLSVKNYVWCESKQKCVKALEEECRPVIEAEAEDFCGKENVASVFVCGDYVRVVGSLFGAGSTFYKIGEDGEVEEMIECPVVGPESISEDCKFLLESGCEENLICGSYLESERGTGEDGNP